MTDSPLLFRWREVLLSETGPIANRRYVLLVLSTYGNEKGADIYPSTRELARATGMSRRRVEGHLREAESEGWIRRRNVGEGQGWRRTRYTLLLPSERGDDASPPTSENVETQRPQLDPERGDAVARRGDVASADVGTERPTTSSVTSPQTSPSPPEGESADADPNLPPDAEKGRKQSKETTWVQTAATAWSDRTGGTSSHGKIGRFLKPLVKQHGEAEVLRRWRKYLATEPIKYLSPAQFAEKFGAWGPNGRKDGGGPPEIDQDDLAGWNPISGDKKKRRRGRP